MTTTAGILLADMPDYLDPGWNDIQLFGSYRTDLGQGITLMRTDPLIVRQFIYELDPGQCLGQ
jgi:hypothetical protein